ncbi:uncharacterized protein LOC141599830 [Silene latifolia]|uniref:uncharacterized protein LOC141599830 n=1 Tax=Silene latifolia TaxID=37657 RepID=UPI003D785B74
MEERQLNFNQPLLSVRRGSSIAAQPEISHRKPRHSKPTLPPLPYYMSDIKSGPIRNPGVVPFQWEHMPGRPKDVNTVSNDSSRHVAVAPKLPPGRTANHKQKQADKTIKNSPNYSSRSRTGKEGSEKEPNKKNACSSDDEDTTFVDASGTLSRTESFYNCSVSGVSGLDGPKLTSTGIFADPQSRDFMMDRFLPAAKAVASETPYFTPRKYSIAREKLEPVKREIKWKKQSPQYTLPQSIQREEQEEDGKEEEDEHDGMEAVSAKLCGLLPKFCLLNPIPGMRDHAGALSSAKSVRTRPVYAESGRNNVKKERTNNRIGELKRLPHYAAKNRSSMDANPGSKSNPDLQNSGGTKLKEFLANPATEKTLYMDSEHMEQSRNSISSSSESRGRNPSVDSLQDIKSLAAEKQISQPKNCDTCSSVVSTPEKSFQDVGEDFNLAVDVVECEKPDIREVIPDNCLLAMAPFLPKSPSESWLSRTLPSMSGKSPSSKSYIGNLALRSLPVDPKRTSMLRTSNFQPVGVGELAAIVEN